MSNALVKVEQLQRLYVDGFQFTCEDEEGREVTHNPTVFERAMIDDAIEGLIWDHEFIDALIEWRKQTEKTQ